MKKPAVILLILCFTLLAGCIATESTAKKSPPTVPEQPAYTLPSSLSDRLSVLDDSLLAQIALRYFIIFGFDMNFSDSETVDYETAFQYIKHAGVYKLHSFNIYADPLLMQYYNDASAIFQLPYDVVEVLISENKISCSELAVYEFVDGVYSIDSYLWDVRPELHQYFDKDLWSFTIPTEIVDNYILGKFNTNIDHSQIPAYSSETDSYTFEPFLGSFQYTLHISDVKSEGNITQFTCTANLSEDVQEGADITHQTTFSIALIDGEYTYLSVQRN